MLHSCAEESLRGAAIKVSSVSSYWNSFFPRPCLEWVSGIDSLYFYLCFWSGGDCYLRYFIPSYDALHLIKWYLHVLLCPKYLLRIIPSCFQKINYRQICTKHCNDTKNAFEGFSVRELLSECSHSRIWAVKGAEVDALLWNCRMSWGRSQRSIAGATEPPASIQKQRAMH